MSKTKEKLFSVTAADCRWDYYRGSGKGGQARNKTENCVRCTHIASGAVGKSEDGRSKDLNKRTAFERMCNTDIFQKWCHKEAMRKSGELALIDAKVESQMREAITEIKVDGKWTEVKELPPEPVSE